MFGIWGHPQAAEITYYGLHALQHRGQEGAGIVINNGNVLKSQRDLGLVNDVFDRSDFNQLIGHAAIGHVFHANETAVDIENVEPLVFRSQSGSMALALTGRIINAYELRSALENEGSILQTMTDTELLAHLIKRHGPTTSSQTIAEALTELIGAYAFLMLTEKAMYVALDPRGTRPLSLGKLGDAYVVASETCAFDMIGATFEREVLPGELIMINEHGLKSTRFALREPRSICAMEYIYFSRPDSDLNGVNVHSARKRMGIELANEAPVDADVVTGIPDSSISAAIGYAEQSGLPYEMGVIKNRYVGRTFIKPSQELREQGVKIKLSPVRGIVAGKRVVMIDDSIVRGTTCKRIVGLLKDAGAREVHVRIASPPIKYPCICGIDVSSQSDLIAANHTLDEIAELIGADSIAFLSVDGLEKAVVKDKTIHQGICKGCFTGEYALLPAEDQPFQW